MATLNFRSLFLTLTIFFCSCIPSRAKISYAEHCNSIVRQPSFTGLSIQKNISVYISGGYISGGHKILTSSTSSSSSSSNSSSSSSSNSSSPSSSSTSSSKLTSLPGELSFYTEQIFRTKEPELFHISGSIYIQGETTLSVWRSSSPRYRRQISYSRSSSSGANFDVSGFWSRPGGMLCAVGTGSFWTSGAGTNQKPSVVFTLNYPNESNISTSIVSGTIKSLDATDSAAHFDTISVLAYAPNNYTYTQIPKVRQMCSQVKVPIALLGFETQEAANYLNQLLYGQFRLEYGKDCSASMNCVGPFPSSSKDLEFLPSFMTLSSIRSTEDGNVHMGIAFMNTSGYDGHTTVLIPGKSLVAEGYWDAENKKLCVLACPLLKNSSIGECAIGLSFWFPAIFTIKDRSDVLGRIWSVKGKSNPGYFRAISLRSLGAKNLGTLDGVKYEYAKPKNSSFMKTCEETKRNSWWNESYPDEDSIADLTFDLTVRDTDNETMSGYAIPMSIGENFYGDSFSRFSSEVSFLEKNLHNVSQTLLNVSYKISYSLYNSPHGVETVTVTDISAEGVYNTRTGKFCMTGCIAPSYDSGSSKTGSAEDSADCEIQIDIQLSPLNYNSGEHANRTTHLNGTIRSTRKKSDPLYFEPLELTSYTMYDTEAREVVERMDMEIIMVLISTTLSCAFIVMQIFYVRKRKDVLTSISIIMLVLMTIGHVIHLVLNFEALFVNSWKRQDVMLWSGGWLEVKEVIMRVTTMLASLLLFRLLQLAWNSKSSQLDRKDLWAAEKKAIRVLLALYFGGAFIAWFAQGRSFKAQYVISYGGLILDGFLLPQIILNVICNSKDKALAPAFYMGTTAVRALPHLYDAYRARYDVPYSDFSYIYANPSGDYYSTAWDIIIPLQGVIFAVAIFLQQKFGGTCFIPQRFRRPGGYVIVPAISL